MSQYELKIKAEIYYDMRFGSQVLYFINFDLIRLLQINKLGSYGEAFSWGKYLYHEFNTVNGHDDQWRDFRSQITELNTRKTLAGRTSATGFTKPRLVWISKNGDLVLATKSQSQITRANHTEMPSIKHQCCGARSLICVHSSRQV